MEKISFLGCGSWGGALGSILAEKNFDVTMWHRNNDIIKSLDQSRRHYLIPNLVFPANVVFTNDISMTIGDVTVADKILTIKNIDINGVDALVKGCSTSYCTHRA